MCGGRGDFTHRGAGDRRSICFTKSPAIVSCAYRFRKPILLFRKTGVATKKPASDKSVLVGDTAGYKTKKQRKPR